MKFEVEVKNVNENACNYLYIIARAVDGKLWYYGADNNYEKALEIAENLGDCVVIKL